MRLTSMAGTILGFKRNLSPTIHMDCLWLLGLSFDVHLSIPYHLDNRLRFIPNENVEVHKVSVSRL